MHIAYIQHEYPPDTGKGGIGTYTWQMAKAIQKLGHTVEVFCASPNREISEMYESVLTHRIKVETLNEFKHKVVEAFVIQHKKYKFDVIECPEIGGEAQLVIATFPELPLVVRLHTPAVLVTRLQNTYQPLQNKLRFVVGALLRGRFDLGYWSRHDKNQHTDPDYLITEKAAIITAPSEAMKQWAVKFWRIKPERIRVIYNPYEPSAELLAVNNAETKRITFLGRLAILKGVVALTEAAKMVIKKHPDWQFRFIGNSEKSHIKGLSMKSYIETELAAYRNQIEIIDWIDYNEIPGYLAQTDMVVIPSLFESFSYVCVEAMSAGKAIAGSKCGGMNELLGEGRGLLFNPQKPNEIAESLLRFISKPELRNSCGIKARNFVQETLNSELIARQMEEVYKSLV